MPNLVPSFKSTEWTVRTNCISQVPFHFPGYQWLISVGMKGSQMHPMVKIYFLDSIGIALVPIFFISSVSCFISRHSELHVSNKKGFIIFRFLTLAQSYWQTQEYELLSCFLHFRLPFWSFSYLIMPPAIWKHAHALYYLCLL